MIQKCSCGKTGCDRYEILPHTSSYTEQQLVDLRDDIESFLMNLHINPEKILKDNK